MLSVVPRSHSRHDEYPEPSHPGSSARVPNNPAITQPCTPRSLHMQQLSICLRDLYYYVCLSDCFQVPGTRLPRVRGRLGSWEPALHDSKNVISM